MQPDARGGAPVIGSLVRFLSVFSPISGRRNRIQHGSIESVITASSDINNCLHLYLIICTIVLSIRTNETRMKRRNAILDEICLTDARPRRASDRTMHAIPPTNHSRILRLKDL